MSILGGRWWFLTRYTEDRVIPDVIDHLRGPMWRYPESFVLVSFNLWKFWANVPKMAIFAHCASDLIPSHVNPSDHIWLISLHLITSDLIWSHTISSNISWSHMISSDLIWSHLISSLLIWSHLISSDLIWSCLITSDLSDCIWSDPILSDFITSIE